MNKFKTCLNNFLSKKTTLFRPQLAVNDIYPQLESETLEFKCNFHRQLIPTYKMTINAFMNHQGGELIFGISNDGIVKGINLNRSLVDDCKLIVDSLYQTEIYPPFPGNLSVQLLDVGSNLSLMIWRVENIRQLNSKSDYLKIYYLSNGKSYVRKNASNLQIGYCALTQYSKLLNANNTIKKLEQENNLLKNQLK